MSQSASKLLNNFSFFPIAVFWDIENCSPPHSKLRPLVFVSFIRDRFFKGCKEVEFLVACDVHKQKESLINELNDAMVTIVHVSSMSKNAADEKLKHFIRRYADTYCSPAKIILISGDINFSSELADLRYRKGFHVILIHNKQANASFISFANERYLFESFFEKDKIFFNFLESPSQNKIRTYLKVQNLPPSLNEFSKSSLQSLFKQVKGFLVSIDKGSAILLVPNIHHAIRACTRYDFVSFFGRRLRVSLLNKDEHLIIQKIERQWLDKLTEKYHSQGSGKVLLKPYTKEGVGKSADISRSQKRSNEKHQAVTFKDKEDAKTVKKSEMQEMALTVSNSLIEREKKFERVENVVESKNDIVQKQNFDKNSHEISSKSKKSFSADNLYNSLNVFLNLKNKDCCKFEKSGPASPVFGNTSAQSTEALSEEVTESIKSFIKRYKFFRKHAKMNQNWLCKMQQQTQHKDFARTVSKEKNLIPSSNSKAEDRQPFQESNASPVLSSELLKPKFKKIQDVWSLKISEEGVQSVFDTRKNLGPNLLFNSEEANPSKEPCITSFSLNDYNQVNNYSNLCNENICNSSEVCENIPTTSHSKFSNLISHPKTISSKNNKKNEKKDIIYTQQFYNKKFVSNKESCVELLISNLDYNINTVEWKNILSSEFKYFKIKRLSVRKQFNATSLASVVVATKEEANNLISQFHRKKIGYKRIQVTFAEPLNAQNSFNDNSSVSLNKPSKLETSFDPSDNSNFSNPDSHFGNNSVASESSFLNHKNLGFRPSSSNNIKSNVVSLLLTLPGHKLPLFQFFQLYNKRYGNSLSILDIQNLKDTVEVAVMQGVGKVIRLNPSFYCRKGLKNTISTKKELIQIKDESFKFLLPYIDQTSLSCPQLSTAMDCGMGCREDCIGRIEGRLISSLDGGPSVKVHLRILSTKIYKLLHLHNGRIPYDCLPYCYYKHFGSISDIIDDEDGVPIEHLISCLPDVSVSKRIVQWGNKKGSSKEMGQQQLLSQLIQLIGTESNFCLKLTDLNRLYVQTFAKSLDPSEYNFNSLDELIESFSCSIQVLGISVYRRLTLTSSAFCQCFSRILCTIFNKSTEKKICVDDLPRLYLMLAGSMLKAKIYGFAYLEDMFPRLHKHNIIVNNFQGKLYLVLNDNRNSIDIEEVIENKYATLFGPKYFSHDIQDINYNKTTNIKNEDIGLSSNFLFSQENYLQFIKSTEKSNSTNIGLISNKCISENASNNISVEQMDMILLLLMEESDSGSLLLHDFYSLMQKNFKIYIPETWLSSQGDYIHLIKDKSGTFISLSSCMIFAMLVRKVLINYKPPSLPFNTFKEAFQKFYSQESFPEPISFGQNNLASLLNKIDRVVDFKCDQSLTISLRPYFSNSSSLHAEVKSVPRGDIGSVKNTGTDSIEPKEQFDSIIKNFKNNKEESCENILSSTPKKQLCIFSESETQQTSCEPHLNRVSTEKTIDLHPYFISSECNELYQFSNDLQVPAMSEGLTKDSLESNQKHGMLEVSEIPFTEEFSESLPCVNEASSSTSASALKQKKSRIVANFNNN